MAKYLCIYREPTERRIKLSPEEMQAVQTAWYAWMQKFSSAILPGGDGLKRSGKLLKAGLVTDGPYAETKEIVASFGVLQADNYDAALAIVRETPAAAADSGWSIEIREMFGFS